MHKLSIIIMLGQPSRVFYKTMEQRHNECNSQKVKVTVHLHIFTNKNRVNTGSHRDLMQTFEGSTIRSENFRLEIGNEGPHIKIHMLLLSSNKC